jgi:hypothetical protein
MNQHDDMLDSIALLALGVLPEAEARSVADHVRDCAECRAEYVELRSASDALGYSAELRTGELDDLSAARLKSRVMKSIATAVPTSAPKDVPQSAPQTIPRRSAFAWLPYGAAAAAAIVAIATSVNNVELRKQLDDQTAATTSAEAFEQRVAAAIGPDSKFYAVPGGEVVTSGGHVFLAMRDMAQPAPGKVYQAWVARRGVHGVAPSVTFVPRPGLTLVELPESADGLAAVAVSVEPEGGSKAPTSTPAFVRSLS